MRNVLIINGNGLGSVACNCGSLATLLRGAEVFDGVQETSVEKLCSVGNLVPDLILHRFLLRDWADRGREICKTTWASAKTFVVLCDQAVQRKKGISSALIDVDDFLFCPYQENELLLRLTRLIKDLPQSASGSVNKAANRAPDRDLLIGDSQSFLQALRKVSLMAQSKAPVVITGETGSGKELLARAIHYRSVRSSKPFIPVNCGALPDELFENELFGHHKGAYTNAWSDEKGLIAEAEQGTLFLDEVDALSPAAQIKLLRFLQSGEYRPLGSARTVVADVRIIAATNADFNWLVEQKLFREDLHYRLNVLTLSLPALRDRGTDVVQLASHFLSVYAREYKRLTPRLSDTSARKLLNYSWPGNVRELEGVIQRAIVLQQSEVLAPEDIELPKCKEEDAGESELFRQQKSLVIRQFERKYIERLLAIHGGNISKAAKAAGKDRRSFQRLVSKYTSDRKCHPSDSE